MKRVTAILAAVILATSFTPVTRGQTVVATGSSRAVTISWDSFGANAAFYQVRRLKPTTQMLSDKPFAGLSFVDTKPLEGSNTYEVSALDANLNQLSSAQATTQVDKNKPTLSMPCNTILSFATGKKTFTNNGKTEQMTAAPIVKDGKMYLVIRYVVEPLGGTIGFEKASGMVTLTALGHTVKMWIGKSKANVDGVDKPIDATNSKVAPFIDAGRTYVPLRFPVESLGRGAIDWFAKEKTAVLVFPLGCSDTVEGQVNEVADGKLTLAFGEGTGDFPVPTGSTVKKDDCVQLSYEEIGDRMFVGNLVTVPCNQCSGEIFSGVVISSSPDLVIKDVNGKTQTYKKGSGIFLPQAGTCVSGCLNGGTVVSLHVSDCPLQVFEGKVVTACQNGEFSFAVGGVSLQVKAPTDFDCSKLNVGDCLTVEGTTDPSDASKIIAKRITVTLCVTGKEYVVYTQRVCTDGKVLVADIDGNIYTLTLPKGIACDMAGGTCLKVTASVEGDSMVATKSQQIQPGKDPNFYNKGFVTSTDPLQFTVAGGRTYSLSVPAYFNVKLDIGTPLELWGRPKNDNLFAVRAVVTPGMAKIVEGRVVDIMCGTGVVIVKTSTGKTGVKVPVEFKCETLAIGDCIKVTGIMDSDTLQASIIEKTECQSGCTGKTFKGTITGVDCSKFELRIRLFEGGEKTVAINSSMKCDTYYKGLCIKVCGDESGDRIVAETIELTDCQLDVCEGKIYKCIIESTDCGANTVTVATKEGEKTLTLPDTVECSKLHDGACAEICISSDKANYVHLLDCSTLGQAIEGTIVAENTVELSDGSKLTLKTDRILNVGDCIVATGAMSDMEPDVFIPTIVAVVKCANSSGISGTVESIDCKAGKLTLATSAGLKEFTIPEGFDCSGILPGDCLFVKTAEGKTSINRISCPQYERIHAAMLVTSTSQDGFTGTDISTMSTLKVDGSYNVSRNDLVVADGHRIGAREIDSAYIEPLIDANPTIRQETLKLLSYDKNTSVATFNDVSGGLRLVLVKPDQMASAKTGDILSIKTYLLQTGFGPRCVLGTDVTATTIDTFNKQTVVGVIFGIDTVDEMILVHAHDGENIALRPADLLILKSVRLGDCVIANGNYDKSANIVIGAKLDVSDCAGGEFGRSFTGIIVAVDGINKSITVAADSSGYYEVSTEAVSQLTGLSQGDCVAVSGVMLDRAKPNRILSKLITRIECKNPSNQPVVVEGFAVDYTEKTKQLRVRTTTGVTWTAFVEMDAMPVISKDLPVRISGRLQGKANNMSKTYVQVIQFSPARWSVTGKVTEKQDGLFKLADGSGRTWVMHTKNLPEKDMDIIAVGIVPTIGLAELEDVSWNEISGWKEAKSTFGGVVFGVSCGNDNLLIRDNDAIMTSLRLPHTGFCGYFASGECVSANGRLQGSMPGLAKVTEIKGNQNSCFDAAVTGKVIARSTTNLCSIMLTAEGRLIRLGFDTEVAAGKLMIGDLAKITGRFMPSAPDTLKVDSVVKFGGVMQYHTQGRIVGIGDTYIFIAETSGRLLKVGLPQGYSTANGLLTRYVDVSGQFETSGEFTAKTVTVTKNPSIAIEVEGQIIKKFDHTILLKDYQGGLWQISVQVDSDTKAGDSVFVAGWADSANWWSVSGAIVIKTSGQQPSSNLMIWGTVKSKDCENGKVTISCDDSVTYDVWPADKGICDSLTVGDRIEVAGAIQNGATNTINGAKVTRPGVIGDKKVITGVIVDISCTSRVLKVKENDRDGIIGSTWTVQLDKSVNCESLKTGDTVRVTGDLVLTQKMTLEDATIEPVAKQVVDVNITGSLVSLDCSLKLCVLESDGRLFRLELADWGLCTALTVGDKVTVVGKSNIDRKQVILGATLTKIQDTEALTVLRAKVDSTGCSGMRVLTVDGSEYWSINFKEGQPCTQVIEGMIITVKGKIETSRTHLLLQAVLLDLLRPKVSVGVIDEIYCDSGNLSIVEETGAVRMVHLETATGDCIAGHFSKGDKIQVSGYQDMLFPSSDIYFAKIDDFGNNLGMVSMDFTGEILDTFDCKDNGIIQVGSGHVVWRVKLPDNSDCKDFIVGNWCRVKGGLKSFKEKTMVATSVESARPMLIGYIVEANYAVSELYVKELKRERKWIIHLENKNDTRNWKKGQYVRVFGDIEGNLMLKNATLEMMIMAKGKIKSIDPASQSIDVEGEDLRAYKIYIKTDWIDMKEFHVDNVITAVGKLEGASLKKEGNVIRDCFIEESSGLPPAPMSVWPSLGRITSNPSIVMAN